MIKEKDYLKAKQIVREYEKQLNISDDMLSIGDKIFRHTITGIATGVVEDINETSILTSLQYNNAVNTIESCRWHDKRMFRKLY